MREIHLMDGASEAAIQICPSASVWSGPFELAANPGPHALQTRRARANASEDDYFVLRVEKGDGGGTRETGANMERIRHRVKNCSPV